MTAISRASARAAYVQAVRADLGPTAVVDAVIDAWEAERAKVRRAKRLPPGELMNNMPSFVRDLVRRVCARHDMSVTWVLGQHPPGYRKATAAVRHEIWKTLYGQPYGQTHISFPMIAAWFGVDHTTVQYGVKKWKRPSIKLEPLGPLPVSVEVALFQLKRRRANGRAYYHRKKAERMAAE